VRRPLIAVALAAAAAFAASSISAEGLTEDLAGARGDARVARVDYAGNERTKREALDELVGIRPGMRLSEIDLEEARQRILRAGIFSEARIDAEIQGGAASMLVTVKEKWTFIPIPFGYFGDDAWSFGLNAIEYNFMGMRRTLAAKVADSDRGASGSLAYVEPRLLGSKISIKAYASGGESQEEARFMDDEPFATFGLEAWKAGLSAAFPADGRLSASLEMSMRYAGVGDEARRDNPELYGETLYLVPGAGISYDGRRRSGYREAGIEAKAAYARGLSLRDAPGYDEVAAGIELKFGAVLDSLATLGLTGRYGSRPFQAQDSLSGPGYRTLAPATSFSDKSATSYASIELPFARPAWCVLTAGPFYECGAYATGPEGKTTEVFHGPGLSARMYVSEVALPAMGIDAAYNVPAGLWFLSAYLGLSL